VEVTGHEPREQRANERLLGVRAGEGEDPERERERREPAPPDRRGSPRVVLVPRHVMIVV
jgi:hypothetical protein